MDEFDRYTPQFTEEIISQEARAISIVDDVLAEYGEQSIEALYSKIQEKVELWRWYFPDIKVLDDFLVVRSNVFEVNNIHVRNRSAEYRALIFWLTRFINDNGPVPLKEIAQLCPLNQVICEAFVKRRGLQELVRKNPNFFKVDSRSFVFLNPICFQIPSAWIFDTLPVYLGSRCDRSVIMNSTGTIVSTSKRRKTAEMRFTGFWNGRKDFIQSVVLSSSMMKGLEIGMKVHVGLCRYYNAEQQWKAFMFRKEKHSDRNKSGQRRTLSNIPKNVNVKVNGSPKSMECVDYSNERAFFNDVVSSEIMRISEVDAAIGDREVCCENLYRCLLSNNYFKSVNFAFPHLKKFLFLRPHLYSVYGDKVRKWPENYRSQLLNFISFVDRLRSDRLTVTKLQQSIIEADDPVINQIKMFAMRSSYFKLLLSENYPIFDIAEHMGEEYVRLGGTFVKSKNLFVPHFYFEEAVTSSAN